MSVDGFATSTDGTHEWMFEWLGDDSGEWNRRALEQAGVHAMGRRSYELMGLHWATSEGPIATAMNENPKAVSSHTLQTAEWDRSRSSAGTLGLLDQSQLMTVPIAIGAGRSPFADLRAHPKLDVVGEERFASGALAQILVPKR